MRRMGIVILVAILAVLAGEAAQGAPLRPLFTGVYPVAETDPAKDAFGLSRIRAAGARFVRLDLVWSEIAPTRRPAAFRADDPADPSYNWESVDGRISRIRAAGLEPLASIILAPPWAERGAPLAGWPGVANPDPLAFAQFARAAALRYDGSFGGLPRVRYWAAWNEPNLTIFYHPQFGPTGPVSPGWYREAVNAFSAAVHGVHPDNIVIAGETAPFRDITPGVLGVDSDWGPLKFMRRLLCINDSGRPTCNETLAFDVWSTHPYTSGGPTHHAALPYDVSLGDLSEMRRTLRAAIRAGHVKSSGPVPFWVTEFSWDSNPPDPCSPSLTLLKRWVPEALYRMWTNGVEVIIWFQLIDLPLKVSFFQSGLFSNASTIFNAKPKPFFQGFRFPFVALRRGNRVYVWAHTPFGKPGRIVVQQSFKGGWTKIKALYTDRVGIAQALLKVEPIGQFRAILDNGEKSLPFSMRVPPDRFFNPFGLTVVLEPNGKSCSS